MKKFLIIALVAFMSFSVFGYDVFSYVPITGNAKSYTCIEYSVTSKFGDYFRTPVSKITHTLNGKAQDVESTEYTPRDVLVNRVQTTYDDNGNITVETGYNASNEMIWKTVYAVKDASKTEASQYGKDSTLKGKTINTYEGNLLVDETAYDGNGVLIWKTVYKYDDTKRLLSETQYFADGSLDEERIYTYTEFGRIDSIAKYSSITGIKKEIFRYNTANGQLNEITTYDANDKVEKRLVFKYDAQGNIAKVSDYNVAEKFGTTMNELFYMAEYTFNY